MASKCTRDDGFTVFNGGLRGKYEKDVTYPQDRLAEKWPDAFEKVGSGDSPHSTPSKKPRAVNGDSPPAKEVGDSDAG